MGGQVSVDGPLPGSTEAYRNSSYLYYAGSEGAAPSSSCCVRCVELCAGHDGIQEKHFCLATLTDSVRTDETSTLMNSASCYIFLVLWTTEEGCQAPMPAGAQQLLYAVANRVKAAGSIRHSDLQSAAPQATRIGKHWVAAVYTWTGVDASVTVAAAGISRAAQLHRYIQRHPPPTRAHLFFGSTVVDAAHDGLPAEACSGSTSVRLVDDLLSKPRSPESLRGNLNLYGIMTDAVGGSNAKVASRRGSMFAPPPQYRAEALGEDAMSKVIDPPPLYNILVDHIAHMLQQEQEAARLVRQQQLRQIQLKLKAEQEAAEARSAGDRNFEKITEMGLRSVSGVYVGTSSAVSNSEELLKYNIGVIVNLAPGVVDVGEGLFTILEYALGDHPYATLLHVVPTINSAVDKGLKTGTGVVFTASDMSVVFCALAAFLIWRLGMTTEAVVKHIDHRRGWEPMHRPMTCLRRWENHLLSDVESETYRYGLVARRGDTMTFAWIRVPQREKDEALVLDERGAYLFVLSDESYGQQVFLWRGRLCDDVVYDIARDEVSVLLKCGYYTGKRLTARTELSPPSTPMASLDSKGVVFVPSTLHVVDVALEDQESVSTLFNAVVLHRMKPPVQYGTLNTEDYTTTTIRDLVRQQEREALAAVDLVERKRRGSVRRKNSTASRRSSISTLSGAATRHPTPPPQAAAPSCRASMLATKAELFTRSQLLNSRRSAATIAVYQYPSFIVNIMKKAFDLSSFQSDGAYAVVIRNVEVGRVETVYLWVGKCFSLSGSLDPMELSISAEERGRGALDLFRGQMQEVLDATFEELAGVSYHYVAEGQEPMELVNFL